MGKERGAEGARDEVGCGGSSSGLSAEGAGATRDFPGESTVLQGTTTPTSFTSPTPLPPAKPLGHVPITPLLTPTRACAHTRPLSLRVARLFCLVRMDDPGSADSKTAPLTRKQSCVNHRQLSVEDGGDVGREGEHAVNGHQGQAAPL